MIRIFQFENVRRFNHVLDLPVQVSSEALRPPHGVYYKRDDFNNTGVTGRRSTGKLEVLFVRLDQRLNCIQVERGRIPWCGGADEMCCVWGNWMSE